MPLFPCSRALWYDTYSLSLLTNDFTSTIKVNNRSEVCKNHFCCIDNIDIPVLHGMVVRDRCLCQVPRRHEQRLSPLRYIRHHIIVHVSVLLRRFYELKFFLTLKYFIQDKLCDERSDERGCVQRRMPRLKRR